MKEIGKGGTMERIRLHLGAKPDLVIWRNQSGYMEDKTGRGIRHGLARGASDLIGILRPSGRFFAFECKAPGKKPSNDQLAFMRLVASLGGWADWGDSVAKAEESYRAAGGAYYDHSFD